MKRDFRHHHVFSGGVADIQKPYVEAEFHHKAEEGYCKAQVGLTFPVPYAVPVEPHENHDGCKDYYRKEMHGTVGNECSLRPESEETAVVKTIPSAHRQTLYPLPMNSKKPDPLFATRAFPVINFIFKQALLTLNLNNNPWWEFIFSLFYKMWDVTN
jgi:hypothetical protein